jgi:hypothetical protein
VGFGGLCRRQTGKNIKRPEADRLARKLARDAPRVHAPGMAKELLEIGKRYAAPPICDRRSDDEILGYNEQGIPS